MREIKIGLVGAGVIGKKHALAIKNSTNSKLSAIVDVTTDANEYAKKLKIPYYENLEDLIQEKLIDGIILATPSDLHKKQGILCAENNIPALIEKPLATTIIDAKTLVKAGEKTGTPIISGHYRRFNSQVETARDILQSGKIGQLIGVSAIWAMKKHDEYYNVDWRTQEGGGPILTNLIHDIDCLRWICGDIETVTAHVSNEIRNFKVEDSAAVTLRFTSGALGSIFLTDAGPSPWSFEASTSENKDFAHLGDCCYRFVGSEGSLEFPKMSLWQYSNPKEAAWHFPMIKTQEIVGPGHPLIRQVEHFGNVIKGEEQPRSSAKDAANTLSATLSVIEASQSGKTIKPIII